MDHLASTGRVHGRRPGRDLDCSKQPGQTKNLLVSYSPKKLGFF
ncbi:hypothetical protein ACFZCY_33510 [Streptomyces sp. NPDC007983]